MIALPLVNQSAITLLNDRKSQPAPEPAEPAFDRNLKDANTRLDQPKQTDRPSGSSHNVPDRKAPDRTVTKADADVRLRHGDAEPEQVTESPDASAQGTAKADRPTDTEASAGDVEHAADQGQAVVEVSTPQAQNQVVSQILTAESQAEVTQTVVTQEQAVAEQAQVEAGQSAPSTAAQPTQSTAGQPVQVEADTVITAAVAPERAQASSQVAIQPNQNKPGEASPTAQTLSDQPSATAQRIDRVVESRQNDSQQTDTRDSSQHHSGSSNADGLSSQTTTHTTGSGLTPQAVVGEATVSAVQSSAITPADQSGSPEAVGKSASQQIKADDGDNTRVNTARIARGLQNAVQQKGGAVTLRLTPPEMGTVRIQLQIHNGTVNAQFHAETESTRTLLNQQLSQLRTSLEQQGLSVERLGVQTMQQSSNTNLQHESQSDRDGQPDNGRSRGGFTRQGGDQRQGSDDTQTQQEFDQALNHAA